MAGSDGISGQGKDKDPWGELARQLGDDVGKGGAASAAGEALGGWSETKPFLPGDPDEGPMGPRKPSGGEKTRLRRGRKAAEAAKEAKVAKGVVGKVLAVVAAHGFLAGAAIVVSVVAFGATGVALLKTTDDKGLDDQVATVGLGGGDKSGPESSTGTTRPGGSGGQRGQAGDDGTGKTAVPPDTTAVETTSTTTRPRPTPTPTPVAPPPPDPTPDPTPEPPPVPAPVVDSFDAIETGWCGDQRSVSVRFTWMSSNAASAQVGPQSGSVVASGQPADGEHSVACVNRRGAGIDSVWVVTVTADDGRTATATVRIGMPSG